MLDARIRPQASDTYKMVHNQILASLVPEGMTFCTKKAFCCLMIRSERGPMAKVGTCGFGVWWRRSRLT